jgi:hypothetical protein
MARMKIFNTLEYDFTDERMLDFVGLVGPRNQPLPTG